MLANTLNPFGPLMSHLQPPVLGCSHTQFGGMIHVQLAYTIVSDQHRASSSQLTSQLHTNIQTMWIPVCRDIPCHFSFQCVTSAPPHKKTFRESFSKRPWSASTTNRSNESMRTVPCLLWIGRATALRCPKQQQGGRALLSLMSADSCINNYHHREQVNR